MFDITSIDELIEALGGDTAVASELGISQPAVANWKVRGEIPGGWHMRLFARVTARGMTMDTCSVFGLPEAEAYQINQLVLGSAVAA